MRAARFLDVVGVVGVVVIAHLLVRSTVICIATERRRAAAA